MQIFSRLRSARSRPVFNSVLFVGMVALAAACSGSSSSDDDDDDDDDSAGSSGSSGKGGSSGRGGTSSVGTGGSTTGSGGSSSGSSGSGGSGGGGFLGQCQDVCDRASACPDTDPSTCADGCAQFNALVTSNICSAEIEALYDCGGNVSDICADNVCSAESSDLVDCLVAYCTDNPNAAICAGQ